MFRSGPDLTLVEHKDEVEKENAAADKKHGEDKDGEDGEGEESEGEDREDVEDEDKENQEDSAAGRSISRYGDDSRNEDDGGSPNSSELIMSTSRRQEMKEEPQTVACILESLQLCCVGGHQPKMIEPHFEEFGDPKPPSALKKSPSQLCMKSGGRYCTKPLNISSLSLSKVNNDNTGNPPRLTPRPPPKRRMHRSEDQEMI